MTYRHYTAYDAVSGATFFPKILDGFPYPTRMCPVCDRECEIVNALHTVENPEIYKAIYMCENPNCDHYDLEVRKCYVRVYYSCEEALDLFETVFLRFERLSKD